MVILHSRLPYSVHGGISREVDVGDSIIGMSFVDIIREISKTHIENKTKIVDQGREAVYVIGNRHQKVR